MTIQTNSRRAKIVTLTGMLFLQSANGKPAYRSAAGNNKGTFSVSNRVTIENDEKTAHATSSYTRYDVWLSDDMLKALADMEIKHGSVVEIEGNVKHEDKVLPAKGDLPERKITVHTLFPKSYKLMRKANFVPEQPDGNDIPF